MELICLQVIPYFNGLEQKEWILKKNNINNNIFFIVINKNDQKLSNDKTKNQHTAEVLAGSGREHILAGWTMEHGEQQQCISVFQCALRVVWNAQALHARSTTNILGKLWQENLQSFFCSPPLGIRLSLIQEISLATAYPTFCTWPSDLPETWQGRGSFLFFVPWVSAMESQAWISWV